jgi:hypothetical protein
MEVTVVEPVSNHDSKSLLHAYFSIACRETQPSAAASCSVLSWWQLLETSEQKALPQTVYESFKI